MHKTTKENIYLWSSKWERMSSTRSSNTYCKAHIVM